MKKIILLILTGFILSPSIFAQSSGQAGRMKEVFQVTEMTHAGSGNTRFYDPWEVTYGLDDSLWITESKNYKVYKMSPNGGNPRMILNIGKGATFLPSADQVFDLQFNYTSSPANTPQGGLAGLALHPKFVDPVDPQRYVFISYIYKYVSTGSGNSGVFFKNAIVRFKYEITTGLLDSPYMVCDTLPGSSDHNSQRLIIAPDSGKYYLYYANGDMGAGQFGNQYRTENAQNFNSYEGKILRFNVDPDGDAGLYDRWIPSTGNGGDKNPFNGTHGITQSAVYSLGLRNNQGFAYANINGKDHLYGQSHGPFSDDEINIIKRSGNYGHPLVIGYSWDGNYDSAAAGNSVRFGGSLPTIISEKANALALPNYQDPIYCFYPALKGDTGTTLAHKASNSPTNTVQRMYWDFNHGSQGNGAWPSDSPSGLDVYTKSMFPGWKKCLLSSTLKGAPGAGGGKIIRTKLIATGDAIDTTNIHNTDTTGYFMSTNRYRDVAISADGLTIYAVIDSNSTTSGPTSTNPINSVCKGCLLKFKFLGYYDNGTTSTLPDTIPVATGTANTCTLANTVNISAANGNNNIWVPITDANSNIVAEINANNNDLGLVTTSFYQNGGAVREAGFFKNLYLDRNITITPTNQPAVSKPVKVRLYITNSEYTNLKNAHNSKGVVSGVVNINSIGVFKNHDVCSGSYVSAPTVFTTTPFTRTTLAGANGYALQVSVPSFSTFYFANVTATLPVYLISFTGSISNDIARLQWVTDNENGTKYYVMERSTDGNKFDSIGIVMASGVTGKYTYNFPDDVSRLTCNSVYYRLKIMDADGEFKYSNIVDLPLPGVAGTLSIHPNPVANLLNVDLNAVANDRIIWQMLDNSGRVLMQGNTYVQKGQNTFSIEVGKLQRGIYFLKVMGSSISQGIKVEKL